MTLIAVYGTLRYGGASNHHLRGCKRVGEDAISGNLYNLGWFPGFKSVPEGDASTVVVDVYEIPKDLTDKTLKMLDVYEGYYPDSPDQSLFERKLTKTVNGCLDVTVYEYLWPVNEDNRIISGDWMDQ